MTDLFYRAFGKIMGEAVVPRFAVGAFFVEWYSRRAKRTRLEV